MNKRYFFATVLVGLAVFTLAFTTATNSNRQLPPSPGRVQLVKEDFDGWEYTAYREGNEVTLEIDLNDTTTAGLEAFRDTNRQLARLLAEHQKTLTVNIVFYRPLSLEEFGGLVDAYELQVTGVEMRAIDGLGDRVTLFTGPEGGQLISEDFIQSTVQWIKEQTGEASLLGVISTEAELVASSYDVLSAESAVFMVDVTRDFAKYHLQQENASLLRAQDTISIAASSGYWHVEDNRLSNP
jgi:hypothetical protein